MFCSILMGWQNWCLKICTRKATNLIGLDWLASSPAPAGAGSDLVRMNVWVDPQPKAYLGASILQAYLSHHMRGARLDGRTVRTTSWTSKPTNGVGKIQSGCQTWCHHSLNMAPNKPNDFCSLSGRDSIWESNPGMASCLVTQPLLENVFAAFVRPFGPHMTTLTQPVFCTTAEQRSVIVNASQPFVFLPPETEAHFFLYLMCFTPRSKGLSYAGLFIIVSFFIVA